MGYDVRYIMIEKGRKTIVYLVHRERTTGAIVYKTYYAWYRSQAAAFDAICKLGEP